MTEKSFFYKFIKCWQWWKHDKDKSIYNLSDTEESYSIHELGINSPRNTEQKNTLTKKTLKKHNINRNNILDSKI